MKKLSYFLIIPILFCMAACKPSLSVKALTGKWHYAKVAHPNASPPDTMKTMDLAEVAPYIQFSPERKWVIVWGGKFLSHGTYTLNGSNMNMTEVLPDGKTRDFVFYVSELTDTNIIFESMGIDGSKVTAVKAP
ncbi:hypothetical protein [Mucilaginibacter dorajii]|uniref:Lipocalin-like domain-containing protein n=1 Tax=Mucilaginibacter dorajii TaxID=692994 RepID=A0ABP7NZY9_9SPHI|nr:hypothetical protein [Mucilaginibacter dorajii]MCS3735637.1 hypothetical protein [Mucilaginibacter dorajii]